MSLTIVETVTIRTRAYADGLRVRLARATARERLLLAGLVAGAILYAPIAAMDARDRAETAYAEALSTRDTARRGWVQATNANNRAARNLAIRDMNDWGFAGSNVDIVRVRIEKRLTDAATDAALAGAVIETNETVTANGPVTWVSAQVQGDLLWAPTFRLLDEVASWPEGFRITRFAFERAPPPAFEGAVVMNRGRVTLGLEFPTRTAIAEAPAT